MAVDFRGVRAGVPEKKQSDEVVIRAHDESDIEDDDDAWFTRKLQVPLWWSQTHRI
jgi:hypothetical protein